MCGIVGFSGKLSALPFLMQGLKALEYRGYDSAGITLASDKYLFTCKEKGRISTLEEKLKDTDHFENCGIGHTRWATHGVPNNLNAHPHTNSDNTISLVHNGIIENYSFLKEKLENLGYKFQSETDSECVVLLLDYYYKKTNNMLVALQSTIKELEGSYALCIVSIFEPDTIYVAKKESPMVLGKASDSSFCASDAPALISYTKDILPLDDGEIAILQKGNITLYANNKEKEQNWLHYPYDNQVAQKKRL